MHKTGRLLAKALRALTHVACISFILVLPIGYYPEDPDSSGLALGVYGGHTQMASVIRSCQGDIVSSDAYTGTEVAGAAYMAVPPSGHEPLVLGLRGGYWETRTGDQRFSLTYWNPNFNLETEYFGWGLGYMYGDVPRQFDDLANPYQDDGYLRVTGHLRIGNAGKVYFSTSWGENSPLVTGGGMFDIGLGYPVGRTTRAFSGLTAGFYDGPGFSQQFQSRIARRLDLDLRFRFGSSGGVFEGGMSAGLVWRIGTR